MSENIREQLANLPDYLGQHLRITLLALAAGIIISVPAAVAVARWRPARWPVLTTAGVIQTIPSLALLALMVPLLGGLLGFWPAIIALTLYSVLPILRNTVTGILSVEPAMVEAARGLGMTPRQQLFRVELPLALPVIIAGIRTATVWTVGIATLSTPVGQTSLGNYIFSGLQTRNWAAVLFGCVSSAALAMVLDTLIAMLESSARLRSRWRAWAGAIGLLIVLAGGIGAPYADGWFETSRDVAAVAENKSQSTRDRPVIIGAKTFTEQYILAKAMRTLLEARGFEVSNLDSLGSTVVFDALRTGKIDCYVDYTGTIWANYMRREEAGSGASVLESAAWWLANRHHIRCLGSLGFENAYALAMRRDRAEQLGIRSIDDLVEHAPRLKIGSDYEFFSRPEWIRLRDTYGLKFESQVSLDSTFMYDAVVTGQADVITAFSSAGQIAAFDLLVLDDPRNAFPPYDAVLLLSRAAADRADLVDALRPLIGEIDIGDMQRANYMVDRIDDRKSTVDQAARWLLDRVRKGAAPSR